MGTRIVQIIWNCPKLNKALFITFAELKGLERESLMYCKGDGKVTFTRPLLENGTVTFDEYVNVLESYCNGDISFTFTKHYGAFPKHKGH